jgi:heme A synthase
MPILSYVPDPQAGGVEKPFILSYLGMRRWAGWVGLALPLAVWLGNWPHALEGSISAYYFTRTGAWFVGSLWVIGFFMFSCRGYIKAGETPWDEIAGRFAGVFALGVALIPMNYRDVKSGWVHCRGQLHYACAALLFFVLALMCLFLFTKSDALNRTPKKLRRNKFYVVCGCTILACIALIGVYSLLRQFQSPLVPRLDCYKPVFWLESGSVLAFAVAWLVKGETFQFIRG